MRLRSTTLKELTVSLLDWVVNTVRNMSPRFQSEFVFPPDIPLLIQQPYYQAFWTSAGNSADELLLVGMGELDPLNERGTVDLFLPTRSWYLTLVAGGGFIVLRELCERFSKKGSAQELWVRHGKVHE